MKQIKPDFSKLAGGFEPKEIEFKISKNKTTLHKKENGIMLLENFLNKKDVKNLIKLMNTSDNFESVSIQGNKDVPSEEGSIRTTIWSEKLANLLGNRLIKKLPKLFKLNNYSPTDFWQNSHKFRYNWRPIGVSPLLRFMRYEVNGQHYTHYDAGYQYSDNIRTLYSIVIYLTTNSSGATRFIDDHQNEKMIWDRDHNDWLVEANKNDVYFESLPVAGNVLIFPHRLAHDVDKYLGIEGSRIIIRGDIICKSL